MNTREAALARMAVVEKRMSASKKELKDLFGTIVKVEKSRGVENKKRFDINKINSQISEAGSGKSRQSTAAEKSGRGADSNSLRRVVRESGRKSDSSAGRAISKSFSRSSSGGSSAGSGGASGSSTIGKKD